MPFLTLSDISLAYGDRDILSDVTIHLSEKSRVALTGANGSGKSTLMKIAAGLIRPEGGTVSLTNGGTSSYLPQEGLFHRGNTVREELETVFSASHKLEEELRSIEHELSTATEGDRNTSAQLEKHHRLQEKLMAGGFYRRAEMCSMVLGGLGFNPEDAERSCEEFSGGWQMKIALAKVLLDQPDFLLLDEPTNYLEIEAREWLENYIRSYPGGVLLVSHDRFFLDTTCDEVAEVFNARLLRFKGTYSHYEKQRSEELEALIIRYREQQEEIRKIEDFINRFRYNASKASQVQSRIKQLEKIERIEIPESMKKVRFTFPKAPRCGKTVLSIRELKKEYGALKVFEDFNFDINRGEKIVIVGRNGAGKSTLMRIAAGRDTRFEGETSLGTGVRIGYFSQEQGEMLDLSLTVAEEAERDAPSQIVPSLRNLLGGFLFRGDDIYKSVAALSGGEKSRLSLLKLLIQPKNFLILDEPTNHLDMNSKDILLEALEKFDGTVLFVSHDRYFIENLATRVLELGSLGPRDFPGDYAYYLWKLKEEQDQAVSAGVQMPQPKKGPPGEAPEDTSEGKQWYEAAKEQKSRLRKLAKEEEKLLKLIESLDLEHTGLQHELAEPAVYSDGEQVKALQKKLRQNEAAQEDAHSRWEQTAEELELLS